MKGLKYIGSGKIFKGIDADSDHCIMIHYRSKSRHCITYDDGGHCII